MTRIAIALAFAAALFATPALADEPTPRTPKSALQEVRSQSAATWARARAARDAMNELRHDGSLATDAGQARMNELRVELQACRAALSALKLERQTIIAARKAAKSNTAIAAR